ncbi:YdeI/OmpD-associated family protein [Sphingobium phenoxybenzoativorans]|uniref:YdeI/OmpD-associated family protein n=1 Tax=Sphingobium phenoxybenzoativorans TaxID=1592790 RepID=A0A975KAL7_9SPHN|nr:YdeI/OmpD-associated family protein [Sphingobium phenoxybenzoativorans]QUT06472.1 YdeI/OmpD-associated family protein [Sphingobium phenoxybenzoativorans]
MPTADPRIDAYIARQAAFARPMLSHLRALVHAVCPDTVEAVKWGMPFFTYKGKNLCQMAAFKEHMSFGLWHGGDLMGPKAEGSGMGQFGRIAAPEDLPDDAMLTGLILKAMALIDAGTIATRMQRKAPRPALPVPAALQAAIDANPAAAKVWAEFSPGKIRDYAEWIGDAKRAETRDKRIAEAVGWIAEGKDRNWKYR